MASRPYTKQLPRETDGEIVDDLLGIAKRCDLPIWRVGALIPLAPLSLKQIILTRTLPDRLHTRRVVEEWVAANRKAEKCADLRILR